MVFRGTQEQLTTLYSMVDKSPFLDNLIPLNKSTFLFVIEGAPSHADAAESKVVATRMCQAALSAGAHFHGFARQAGNRLLDASFSMVP